MSGKKRQHKAGRVLTQTGIKGGAGTTCYEITSGRRPDFPLKWIGENKGKNKKNANTNILFQPWVGYHQLGTENITNQVIENFSYSVIQSFSYSINKGNRVAFAVVLNMKP